MKSSITVITFFTAFLFLISSCTKTDPYLLTDAARNSLDRFVGEYKVTEMRWIGPVVDTDMDGVADELFTEDQVMYCPDKAYVEGLERLDQESQIELEFPVSRLSRWNGGQEYHSPGNPQMISWLMGWSYTVDSDGIITINFEDFDMEGQYLKNITIDFTDNGFVIFADSHVWDFFTGREVKGKLSTTYEKKL